MLNQFLYLSISIDKISMTVCGCRCIKCKSQQLDSFKFVASDGFDDMHHTCLSCDTHFSHVDGEHITHAKHATILGRYELISSK